MKTWACAGVLVAGLVAGPVRADDQDDRERALKQFFEGRSVTVRIDMPATQKGIDINVGYTVPIDGGSLADRIAQTGVSIREGARVPITKVHLKDDLIEFHLAGGGFNWFWDTQGTVSPDTGKSHRERELEKQIRNETDPDRRRDLEHELREVRHEREREDRHRREMADLENSLRAQEDHQRALLKGSRFNLRWDDRVPSQAETPRAVMELLSPWVDFSGFPGAPAPPRPPRRPADDAQGFDRDVRTGMSWADVQDRWGAPDHLESSHDGDLRRADATYRDRGLELTFVNDVLVRIRRLETERR
jgi:hypothetical protein